MQKLPPGTLVFFAGREFISRLIAFRTCSLAQLWAGQWLSHVGIVFYPKNSLTPWLCESTSLDGSAGVRVRRLSETVSTYDGQVWACSLNKQQRLKAGLSKILNQGIMDKVGMGYDLLGAAICGTEFLRRWWHFSPNTLFCSELCVWLLRQVHVDVTNPEHAPGAYSPACLARDTQKCSLFEPLSRIK